MARGLPSNPCAYGFRLSSTIKIEIVSDGETATLRIGGRIDESHLDRDSWWRCDDENGRVRGPDAMKLTINGVGREVKAPPDMPLLWVLRDLVGLTGTKFGCGMAQCGACTVHLDGAARRSCITPVAVAVGTSITTIEGLSPDGRHPVQRAWAELDVVQCGYCQSGQIMSAAALLAVKPDPSDADIDAALTGNICRCGTYQRIRAAVHRAATLAKEGTS